MFAAVLLTLLPALVASTGDGNIRLLEEDIAAAIKACIPPKESRQRRSDEFGYDDQYGDKTPRIDGNTKLENNQYSHERRNSSDIKNQMQVLNATDYDYAGYGAGNVGERVVNTVPRPANGGGYSNDTSLNRTRRNEPLLNKDDADQVRVLIKTIT